MKPHKIYAEYIEGKALSQFYDAMKSDFAVQGALMPDAHAGYSLPIGAVVAASGVVVPAWVGYDIGCGMCAVPTEFNVHSIHHYAQEIWELIQKTVPVGFNHRTKPTQWSRYEQIEKTAVTAEMFETAGNGFKQLGTLGGGNHFIEIGVDDDKRVWVIIHSGSRNVGHKIATHYMNIAGGGKAREGHYPLDVASLDGENYIKDLNFGLEFALENRMVMMRDIERCIKSFKGIGGEFCWEDLINRNHNHAEFRAIEGYPEGVWIHRKGATHADAGMKGVIPGNMRDGSFIVRGLGNPDALFSSSHGAGRVLGRRVAKETLSVDEFRETMKGIISTASKSTLDESPMAYKDIYEVMDQQDALVEIIAHVKPILNVKG